MLENRYGGAYNVFFDRYKVAKLILIGDLVTRLQDMNRRRPSADMPQVIWSAGHCVVKVNCSTSERRNDPRY